MVEGQEIHPFHKPENGIDGVPDIFESLLAQAKEMGLGTTQNASCDTAVNADVCMATDFVEASRAVAERVCQMLDGEGKAVISIGSPGNQVHQQEAEEGRVQGRGELRHLPRGRRRAEKEIRTGRR